MTTTTPSRPARAPAAPVPEWPIERFVKKLGIPAKTLGNALDRMAKLPLLGPLIKLFSSVVLGIIILALIGIYIAIGSGFANVRAALEMTDLQFFNAWPMRLLLVLLVLDLSIVTLRRIPLTLFKLGSWTVHTGILTLIAGCVWYFGWKLEGSVRIYLNQTVTSCFDVTERALYAFPLDARGDLRGPEQAMTPLPNLPIYFEHLAENGKPLSRPVPGAFQGLSGSPAARLTITGYYPCAVMQPQGWRGGLPGEQGEGVGLAFDLTSPKGSLPEAWLIGATPAGRLLEGENMPVSFEFLRQPSANRLKDIMASFDGPLAATVRAGGVEKTFVAKPGVEVAIEGTAYSVTPMSVAKMPMASKGYEKTASTAMTFGVKRKNPDGTVFEFERMSLFRYPERSPDFVMENGQKKRRQEGVDPNVEIIFHDASMPQVWFVEGADKGLTLVWRDVTGKSRSKGVKAGEVVNLELAQYPGLGVRVTERNENVVAVYEPMIVPKQQRPRGQTAMEAMQLSIIEVEASGGSGGAEWKKKVYVPFSPYAEVGEPPVGQKPAVLEVPGYGKVGLLMSTTRRAMPSAVTLEKFDAIKQPGAARVYADYISTIRVKPEGSSDAHVLKAQLNAPAVDAGLYYFQAAWDGDDNAPPEKRFTVLGVANRPGIWLMAAGSILIILGIGYAFYVKPILLKMKKESVARWAGTQRGLTT